MTETQGIGRRERKKLRTRDDILRAGLELFLRQGFKETTVAQIAAAADVAQSTVFLHFATKEDLVLADHDAGARSLVERLRGRGGSSTVDVLRAIADRGMPAERWDRGLWELRARVIAAEPALAGQERARFAEVVRPVLVEELAADLGRPPDAPEAHLLAGMTLGALLEVARLGSDPAPTPAEDRARYWSGLCDVLDAAVANLRA